MRSLECDLRFEHLEAGTGAAIDALICEAVLDPKADPVTSFREVHEREVEDHTCCFNVEFLTVSRSIERFGATLRPAPTSQEVPSPFPFVEPARDSIIAVAVRATSRARMIDRARERAERALRLWRACLRDGRDVPDVQLRFGLGEYAWFEDEIAGWRGSPNRSAALAVP
jgi:hypothetical protein